MLGYSKIQIMGNVGNVPEMKYLPSGDQVVNFSVAVNRRYKDRRAIPRKILTGIASALLMESGPPVPNSSAAARPCSWKDDCKSNLRLEERRTGIRRDHPDRGAVPRIAARSGGCNAAPWAAKIGEADPPPERRNRRRRRRSVLTSLRQAVSSRRRLL